MSKFPLYIDLELTARCNLECGFCFGPSYKKSSPDLPFSFWKNVLSDIWKRGCEGVVISGGEPTLYPRLGEVLKHAKQLGLQTVLSTNGRQREKLLSVANWCDWVALPVDAIDLNMIDLLRSDTWGLACAVSLAKELKLITNGHIRVKLGTVATKINLPEVVKISESLNAMPHIPFDTWKIYQYTPRRKFLAHKHRYELDNTDFDRLSQLVYSHSTFKQLNTVFSSHSLRRRAYLFVYPDGTLAIPNEGVNFSDIVIGNMFTEGESILDRLEPYNLIANRNNYDITYA